MKYLCLAYGSQEKMSSLTPEEFEALVARCGVHDEQLRASGHFVSADSLEWETKTIRAHKGEPFVSDGPLIAGAPQVGAAIIIEASDIDEAVRIASLHPAAHLGEQLGWAIEVHAIADGCHQ